MTATEIKDLIDAITQTVVREALGDGTTGVPLKLVESAAMSETIALREAKSDYEIKLIAPGKGSSAFYPAEVLKRDGPKVFKAGTHIFTNHPTAAEEAARPEGDVRNLAGVLTSNAVYHESHTKGPGLYGRIKVFADHAQMVEEKAAHVGLSIRASGIAESGAGRDGVPILKSLTAAHSIDVVTRAGAGGMILTEADRVKGATQMTMTNEINEAIERGVREGLRAAGIAPESRTNLTETVRLPSGRTLDLREAAQLGLKAGEKHTLVQLVEAERVLGVCPRIRLFY